MGNAVSIGKAHAKHLFSTGRSRQQERGVYAAKTPARAEPFWMARVALPADIWQPEGRVPITSPGARQTDTMRMNRYLTGLGICLAWLAEHMRREADLAFREAFALCPRIDALSGYEEMLLSEERTSEARLLRECRGKFSQRAP